MAKTHLYFIALIPPPDLGAQVTGLKNEMRSRFEAKHALKSPPHITLQMPFKRPPEKEAELIKALQVFAGQQVSFPVALSGFDSFPPRVIFIKIVDHQPIVQLYSRLREMLIQQLAFPSYEPNQRFHPHMTIATRDLRKAAFRSAWAEFQERKFDVYFEVKSLFLLKHNGRHWDIYHEFGFMT